MHALEALEARAGVSPAYLDACLLDSLTALRGWPQAAVDAAGARFLLQGRPVRLAGVAAGALALTGPDGRLLAIGEADSAGLVSPRRWLGTDA